MPHREFKDALYEQFARIGHAVSSPKRIELLDLLSQGEKTVETLALQSSTPVKNTSAHLRVLRSARLVETRKEGLHVFYRLAGDSVFRFLRDLQAIGRSRLAEVEQVVDLYLDGRDDMEPLSLSELRRRLRKGDITLLDVRPREEYDAAHIPGALSIPIPQLGKRFREVPKNREVVAYCRGPYCVYAVEAVEILRRHGYRARRVSDGLPDWRAAKLPVAGNRRIDKG